MISLSSGLLQFVSDAYLVTPDSARSSATSDNGLAQLSALANQQKSTAKSQTSTSSSSSARLADDTYTPSTQSLTLLSSSASSKTSSSNVATSSSQASQSNTVTLASLVKNQTISGSAAARQVLLAAIEPYAETSYSAVSTAWDNIGTDVQAGDYSSAQTELTNYTTALTSLHYDVSIIKTPVDALGSALQAGNKDDVQAAFTSFTNNTTEGLLGVSALVYTGAATQYAAMAQMVAPSMTDELQKVGYTASNAAAEANAIVLGIMVDDATIKVNSAPTTDLSSQVDQSIADLGKSAANSTDQNMLSNIIVGMAQANSVTAMESTLSQLDSKYGSGTQGTSANSAVNSSTISVYA
ncbi:MAG: hypothetical protein P4K83_06930 [Terracidiphilus sp.]|nr:hypothetical protein [Terracidiphilus sp.]